MSRRRVLLARIGLVLDGALLPAPNWTGSNAFASERVAFLYPVSDVIDAPVKARISADVDLVISRGATCWPLGGSASNSAGSITLLNGDRALDYLYPVAGEVLSDGTTTDSVRDAPYELLWCWDDEAADPSFTWAQCRLYQRGLIDRMESSDNGRKITFYFADPLAILDVPLQRDLWPDDCPNESIRGKPKPITIGQVNFAPGVLVDTRETLPGPVANPDAWSYDVHSDAVFAVSAAYDRGDVFTPSTDYDYRPARTGIKLVNKPDRPVCFTAQGALLNDGAATTWDFINGTWSGGMPSGWWKAGSTGTITQVAGGMRMQATAVQTMAPETSTNVLSANKIWHVRMEVGTVAEGSATPVAQLSFLVPTITRAGSYEFAAGSSPTARVLRIWHTTRPLDITIAHVTIQPVVTTDALSPFIRWTVARATAGGSAPTLDTTAIDTLATAAPYQVGTHEPSPVTALTVLQRLMDGWCGWITAKRDGSLTVGRLQARGVATGTVYLTTASIVGVQRRDETAPNLSRRLAGVRTHLVHSDGDIAASVDEALRAQLQAEYVTKSGVGTLPSTYSAAESADAQPTYLQSATDLQTEATRVASLFAKPLVRYEVDALLSEEVGDSIEIGDWVHVTHPSYGLDAGRWCRVLGITYRFRSRQVSLSLLEIPE